MSLFKLIAVGLLCGALSACGFQPLYYQDGQRASIRTEMATVFVRPIADRIGQELRIKLKKALNPTGVPSDKKWDLYITLTESTQKIALESTSFSTRANLSVAARFELNRIGLVSEESFSSNTRGISSYNIVDSDYADIVAERDARSRAVVGLSNDIRRQLALWLREVED